MARRIEVRRKGRQYAVVDTDGRVYGHHKSEQDAVRHWRRAMKGASREMGERVGPRQFDDNSRRR